MSEPKQVIVRDWKQVWRYYSAWALALLMATPDLYTAMVATGLVGGDTMPPVAAWAVRIVAMLGLLARFLNQSKPDGLPPKVG